MEIEPFGPDIDRFLVFAIPVGDPGDIAMAGQVFGMGFGQCFLQNHERFFHALYSGIGFA